MTFEYIAIGFHFHLNHIWKTEHDTNKSLASQMLRAYFTKLYQRFFSFFCCCCSSDEHIEDGWESVSEIIS